MTTTEHAKTRFSHYRDIPTSYESLHAFFPLRPLRGASDYDRVSRLLGAQRSLGAKILQGERSLTVPHLRILTEYFNVSADLFLPAAASKVEA
jgi:antitoxin component HigA of HigAB toxin-antitoxin module